MSWTADETSRVQAIEKAVNAIQLALKNVASSKQLRTLLVLKQKEIDDLTTKTDNLQTQLSLMQAKL